MRKRAWWCLALLLALLTAALSLSCPAARADSPPSAMFAAYAAVKVYKSPKLSGKVLGTVWFGEEVAVDAVNRQTEIATLADGKGRTGYCDLNLLSDSNPNTCNTKIYAQLRKVRVYTGCSEKTKRLTTLKRNETVTMVAVAPTGGWLRVRCGGKYGYVLRRAMDTAPYDEGVPAWCVYDGTVAVMTEPQGWEDLGTLCLGDAVRLLDRRDGWAKIRNAKGEVGWCGGECVSTKSPILNQKVYAQVSDRILARRPGGSAGLKVDRRVKKGAKLTLVARGDFWARVKYKGRTYYTPAIYLADSKAPKAGRVVVAARKCSLQDAPEFSGNMIAQLPQGALMRLLAGGPLFAKVETLDTIGGKAYTGWVLVSQLTAN